MSDAPPDNGTRCSGDGKQHNELLGLFNRCLFHFCCVHNFTRKISPVSQHNFWTEISKRTLKIEIFQKKHRVDHGRVESTNVADFQVRSFQGRIYVDKFSGELVKTESQLVNSVSQVVKNCSQLVKNHHKCDGQLTPTWLKEIGIIIGKGFKRSRRSIHRTLLFASRNRWFTTFTRFTTFNSQLVKTIFTTSENEIHN